MAVTTKKIYVKDKQYVQFSNIICRNL